VDPDETTPENEVDKQLSPVSYPKVPRPSNQAIPRSPLTTSSRKVTLAEKRRGEDLSLDLGHGLMISNFNEAPDTPLRKYSRRKQQRRNHQTPRMELKSPLWEPKLTPSRRGDDLFLSVEVKGRWGKGLKHALIWDNLVSLWSFGWLIQSWAMQKEIPWLYA
jgi:hypothetical protein